VSRREAARPGLAGRREHRLQACMVASRVGARIVCAGDGKCAVLIMRDTVVHGAGCAGGILYGTDCA
jgi:hypothetical protein